MSTKLVVPVTVLLTTTAAFAGGTSHYMPSDSAPTVALSHQLTTAQQNPTNSGATAASSHLAQVAASHAVAQGHANLQAQGQPIAIQNHANFANTAWVKHGWFAGIGAGTALVGHTFYRHFLPLGHNDVNEPVGDVGPAVNVFGGYSMSKGMLSLVGQAGVDFSTAKGISNDSWSTISAYQSVRNQYMAHLDVQPGVLFQNSRFYTDLGVTLGHYKAVSSNPANTSPNYSTTQIGWSVGAGMQTRATNHIDLRVNYADMVGSQLTYTQNNIVNRYRPSMEVFTAGVVYNFSATTDKATTSLPAGPYMGFMFGRDAAEAHVTASGLQGENFNSESAMKGLGGRIYAGFSRQFNRFVGSVEGYYALSTAQVKRSGGEYSYTYEINNSYGVSLLPGLQLDSASKVYARLGAVWTNFEKTQGAAQPTMVNKTAFGLQAGVGLETALDKNLSLRTEYDFTHYNTVNFDNTLNTVTAKESVSPRMNQFMVGLTYHFIK